MTAPYPHRDRTYEKISRQSFTRVDHTFDPSWKMVIGMIVVLLFVAVSIWFR